MAIFSKQPGSALDNSGVRVTFPGWLKWLLILLALFMLISWINPFIVVPAGNRGVVMTFGKVGDDVLGEGLHIVKPIADRVKLINIQVQKLENKADAGTKDLQHVEAAIALNLRVDPAKAGWIFQNIGDLSDINNRIVQPAVEEVVKAVTAHYSAEQLLTERTRVSAEIKDGVLKRLAKYGLLIEDFSITNFAFSQSYQRAIDEKVVVEQQKLTAERERDKAKIEAEKAVAVAEGQKQSKIKAAEAEAEAIRIQREALRSSPEIIELRKIESMNNWIEKWDGRQPSVTMGQSGVTPMLDLSSMAHGEKR